MEATIRPWFRSTDKAELATAAWAYGNRLWELDANRREEGSRGYKRLTGRDLVLEGMLPGDRLPGASGLRVNVTRAAVESICAKAGNNRPRPTVLTDGGNWSLQARCRKLQRFLDGVFVSADVYAKLPDFFRDQMVFGTAIHEWYGDLGRKSVCLRRVFPLSLMVDPLEAASGDPTTFVRVRFWDPGALATSFPSIAGYESGLAEPETVALTAPMFSGGGGDQLVRVYELTRIASYTDAGKRVPGRTVWVCGKCVLRDDTYDHDFPPYEFTHWVDPMVGFWGGSAIEEVEGLERELNILLQSAQRAMRRVGVPWVLIPETTDVKTETIGNEEGQIIRYNGNTPPTVQAFQPMHPQVMEQPWVLYRKVFELLGTNENAVAARKPPGDVSGRALEQLAEEHLVRFQTVTRKFENVVGTHYPRQILRVVEMLNERIPGGFKVRAVRNQTAIELRWSECKVAPDDFFVQCWPTSILPHTPAGRTAEVERWQQNGWTTPQQAKRLLEFPDLNGMCDVQAADDDLLEWQLEQMLVAGKAVLPETRQDLAKALQWGTYRLERAIVDGAPEAHADHLRDFLATIEDMLAAQEAQSAAAAPPGGPAPTPGAPVM